MVERGGGRPIEPLSVFVLVLPISLLSAAAAAVLKALRLTTTESSLFVLTVLELLLVRVKLGRGLRFGACCAADARYDAGLNDRLAMALCDVDVDVDVDVVLCCSVLSCDAVYCCLTRALPEGRWCAWGILPQDIFRGTA